eukprot:311147-Pleurochrysis_carterae.AAC.1
MSRPSEEEYYKNSGGVVEDPISREPIPLRRLIFLRGHRRSAFDAKYLYPLVERGRPDPYRRPFLMENIRQIKALGAPPANTRVDPSPPRPRSGREDDHFRRDWNTLRQRMSLWEDLFGQGIDMYVAAMADPHTVPDARA